mmetsp:Transcript_25050/g.43244  ORF Transcript_25050/g.43244 Transcript_25050/m.43244 type:complete len:225 (+) Transcript_25050:900-1574(+)
MFQAFLILRKTSGAKSTNLYLVVVETSCVSGISNAVCALKAAGSSSTAFFGFSFAFSLAIFIPSIIWITNAHCGCPHDTARLPVGLGGFAGSEPESGLAELKSLEWSRRSVFIRSGRVVRPSTNSFTVTKPSPSASRAANISDASLSRSLSVLSRPPSFKMEIAVSTECRVLFNSSNVTFPSLSTSNNRNAKCNLSETEPLDKIDRPPMNSLRSIRPFFETSNA